MIPIKSPRLDVLVQEHFKAIKDHLDNRSKKFSYHDINNWFLNNGMNLSFKEVVLADLKLLPLIKNTYKQHSPFPEEILFLKDNLYGSYFANSSTILGNDKYNAAKLVEKLEIKVCPYCNRNYINNVTYANKGLKRTSQMDHYYCKEKYPFLAMSFYNLIPSCSSCNHIKHNKHIFYSPYDTRYSPHDLLKFGFEIKSIEFISNEDDLNIKVLSKNFRMKKNIKVFELESLYNIHKDIVQELYKKKLIYTDIKLEEINREFNGLFKDKAEMERIIFGSYMNEEELNRRPLAKMMSDIYLDLS